MTGIDGSGTTSRRPLRADAQRNEDRLLEAAAEAFAEEGPGASVKDVARRAGVGVGTLYRRFPSKELLIEAVYRHEVQRLCGAAEELAATLPPVEALRTWMERFIDFMEAKQGMADALRVILTDDGEKLHTRTLLVDAIAWLLDAGEGAPPVPRPDADARDVLIALGGISLMAAGEEQRELASRLIDLLLRGVVGH
ncbi:MULTISPECIES: TetR/AcrR family transcriptional regulator [unclassified Streptomyces]|uniref:TetR/AcrR family transcriptional regulator n=1 Tax=unclassified Streptomyces TaxID=2593676 RepID=UPI003325321D